MVVKLKLSFELIESGLNKENKNPTFVNFLEGNTSNWSENPEEASVDTNGFAVMSHDMKSFEVIGNATPIDIEDVFALFNWDYTETTALWIYAYFSSDDGDLPVPVPFKFCLHNGTPNFATNAFWVGSLALSHIVDWPDSTPSLALRFPEFDTADKTVLVKIIATSNKKFDGT